MGRLLRQGKRLMVRPFDKAQDRQAHQPGKGKRNKFNLSPFPLAPFPFPIPNAPCPMPNAQRLMTNF
ncbi:hypothetical protein [Nostoc linckia]|nr:hypothetical protein [Nostoc linckia]PHK41085.1 hypothetical protein VF12_08050 [Nostoc linckia z15]